MSTPGKDQPTSEEAVATVSGDDLLAPEALTAFLLQSATILTRERNWFPAQTCSQAADLISAQALRISEGESLIVMQTEAMNAAAIIIEGLKAKMREMEAELARVKDELTNRDFWLHHEKQTNGELEQDYLAIWKAVKHPDKTVLESVLAMKAELARAKADSAQQSASPFKMIGPDEPNDLCGKYRVRIIDAIGTVFASVYSGTKAGAKRKANLIQKWHDAAKAATP